MVAYSHFHNKYLAHRLTLEGLGEDGLTASLSTARVDMKPHYVEAALFALHSPLLRNPIRQNEALETQLPSPTLIVKLTVTGLAVTDRVAVVVVTVFPTNGAVLTAAVS